jgi:hypothetical protein
MTRTKWYTEHAVFVAGLGWVMAGFFAVACFAARGSLAGSDLVPAAVLQKLQDHGRACQTLTDEEIFSGVPRRPC